MSESQMQTPAHRHSDCDKRHWRVFYTRPRAEIKVEEVLKRSEIEVFLPRRVVIRRWSDRKRKVVLPLFPGYIFARVDEMDRIRVLRTDGVVRTICFNGKPAIVPKRDIGLLQNLQKDPERLEAIRIPLPAIGTPVKISHGPFLGMEGEVMEHRRRFFVLIRLPSIHQAVKIEMPSDWVTSVNG